MSAAPRTGLKMTLAAILCIYCFGALSPVPAMAAQQAWMSASWMNESMIGASMIRASIAPQNALNPSPATVESPAAQDQSGGSTATTPYQAQPGQARNPAKPSTSKSSTSKPSTSKTATAKPSGAKPSTSKPLSSSPGHPANTPAANKKPAKPPRQRKSTGRDCSKSSSRATSAKAPSPCPPPKVVVKNGGSDESSVELTGASDEQQRSTTEQLTAATEDNLKKIEGHPLDPKQQDTLDQVKQFIEQSKAAVAAGDLDRGRDLAMKAHLLSDELVQP